MNENDKTLGGNSHRCAVVWLVLLIGLFVQSRTTITPIETGAILSLFDIWPVWRFGSAFGREHTVAVFITLFDIVTPLLTVCGLIQGWITPPTRIFWLSMLLISAIVIAHSAVIFAISEQAIVWYLIKDTIKILVLIVLFACLYLIFQNPAQRIPPRIIVLGYFVVLVPAIIYLDVFQPIFLSRTNQAFILVGLIFLLASTGSWTSDKSERLILIALTLAIAVVCVAINNKAPASIALIFAYWFTIFPLFRNAETRRITSIACISIAALLAIFGVYTVILEFSLLPNIDSIERSVTVRIRLWEIAWLAFLSNFPFGTGVGQMTSILQQNDWAVRESHLQVHSSFLNLGAELGVLGLAIIFGILWTIVRGARSWTSALAPPFLLLIVLPLLIHDGHSIRIWLLIAALSLAQCHYPKFRS
jgi:O-antigen ligase